MALTPATTLVSLTAYRALDYEFFADSDSTELDLIRTHQLERQHQLSEEFTLSHQQSGFTWVGGVFLFGESDHQIALARSAAGTIPAYGSTRASTRPAARCSDRRRLG